MTELEKYKDELHAKKRAAWHGVCDGSVDRATAKAIDNEYSEILHAIRDGATTIAEFNAMKNDSAESQESSEPASLKVIDRDAAEVLADIQTKGYETDYNSGKTDFVLPDSVCKIEECAFSEFEKLESVDMSNCINLTEIGKEAFSKCTNLERVVFPPNLEKIDYSAFESCENLKEISLPQSLKEIGGRAFAKCKSLEKIEVSSNLDTLGESCFGWSEKLESIDFSGCDKLTILPKDIFCGCISLEEIEWPVNLKEIGDSAFGGCESLRRIDLPDSIEKLGGWIFSECSKMKSVSLPASLKKLPNLMGRTGATKTLDMSRCKKLRVLTEELGCTGKNISFPMGVEEIEKNVFLYSQFKSIFLPPTATEVELDSTYTSDTAVYCYAPELDTLENLLDCCDCLYVLPQYIDNYTELAEAEEVEGNIDVIPDDKIYFYEE